MTEAEHPLAWPRVRAGRGTRGELEGRHVLFVPLPAREGLWELLDIADDGSGEVNPSMWRADAQSRHAIESWGIEWIPDSEVDAFAEQHFPSVDLAAGRAAFRDAWSLGRWRVALWVRLLTLAQAVGWVWLVLALGLRGDETAATWTILFVFVVVVPFAAWFPMVSIRDGVLRVRDLTVLRSVPVEEVDELALTQWGLRIAMADGTRMTTIVFQAIRARRGLRRVYDFASAVACRPIAPDTFSPFAAARPGGAVVWSRIVVTIPDDMVADGDIPTPAPRAVVRIGLRLSPGAEGPTIVGEVAWARFDRVNGLAEWVVAGESLTVLVAAAGGPDETPVVGSTAVVRGELSAIRTHEYSAWGLPDLRREWVVDRVRTQTLGSAWRVELVPRSEAW